MKNKKCIIYIAGTIAIIGLIGFAILQFRWYELIGIYGGTIFLSNLRQFGMVITSGVFTSALVTFLISVSEYKNERTETLENVYFAVRDLDREFSKIVYFLPNEPEELVKNLLGELDNNEHNLRFNKSLADTVSKFENEQEADEVYARNCMKLHYDAQNAFRDYVWQHTDERIKEIYKEPFQINEYLDEECTKKIKVYHEQLEDTMKSFLQFQKMRTSALKATFRRMDFIFANKSIRDHIQKNLYCKLMGRR